MIKYKIWKNVKNLRNDARDARISNQQSSDVIVASPRSMSSIESVILSDIFDDSQIFKDTLIVGCSKKKVALDYSFTFDLRDSSQE